MKRWLRRLGVTSATLILVGSLGLVGTLTSVDPTPSRGTAYQRLTAERLQSIRSNHPPVEGALKVGFGRARLTPSLGAPADRGAAGEFRFLPLAGFGNRRGAPATGVHDDLWVKATAVEVAGRRIVLVSADALIIPREVAEAATAELGRLEGIDRNGIHFGASHSHASLGGWGEGFVAEQFAGPYQPEVRVWFAKRLVAAATNALRDLSPGAVATAGFEAPDLIRNRLVGDRGTVDPGFALLAFRQDRGARGVIGSFGAHATVLPSRLMEFSAEYPGVWQRQVEAAGWTQAQFFAGGVGSHSPNPGASGFEGIERMGSLLASRTTNALLQVSYRSQAVLASIAVPVELPELHPRVADAIRIRPWLASHLLPVVPTTVITGFRLGDLLWLTTPCDFSGEMALPRKTELARRGLRGNVSSFNGDYIGYVVPAKYYHLDAYETRTMSFFGPAIPDYFEQVLDDVTAALLEPAH